MKELVRVQKLIAQSGFCSRRKAEEYIEKKLVKINGQIAKLGDRASEEDEIKVNNKLISLQKPNFVYFILNKPKKTISSVKDPKKRTTVVDIINYPERIAPVGRLDYDTTGAILLTNDWEMINKLTHPKYEIQRTYRVRIDSPLSLKEFKLINVGLMVNGKFSKQVVDQVDTKSYLVTLHVGSYHHIKELFKALNHSVINLKRLSFANLTVEKMPEGSFRTLTLKELKDLKTLISLQEKKLCQSEKK
ncbi:pseudouridine synthase [Mycoplasmopsis caviae]|uniref:Pseudouridine synthase n=1 Tax=Mycoplasmopsis caviae TaxID=55603 RepID=A0A3P8MEP2_9BACT|nr:pseudouridine synthase [Mycoplasmopsis caviae]UUD35117.1 pseudouridine synthase [Mycoplasmopsis caviae]VDR42066.1 ribosomal large subunit pseudouridine synthaseB [Mycoplasmopsis caviae]